jgi:hypothetical protein
MEAASFPSPRVWIGGRASGVEEIPWRASLERASVASDPTARAGVDIIVGDDSDGEEEDEELHRRWSKSRMRSSAASPIRTARRILISTLCLMIIRFI